MAEDMNDHKEEPKEYSFIEETIRPKKKTKLRKVVFTIGMAVLFGVIGSLTFCLSFTYMSQWFGIERLTVSLGEQPLDKQTATPSSTIEPSPSVNPEVTPQETPIIQQQIIQQITEQVPADLSDLNNIYYEITRLATQINYSIVTVTSVKNGVNLFQAPYEKTSNTSGVIIANNGRELLILVAKDRIKDANNLRVSFYDGSTFDATMYSSNEELGITIIGVSLLEVPNSLIATCREVSLGESYTLETGDPVIALGNPNGYMYSLDMGMVSNPVETTYITDCKLDLFNTNIPDNTKGDGIIVNMQGKVVGLITRQFKQELNRNINTCLGISKIKPILEKMINQEPITYCGVVAQDITSDIAERINVNVGVYVTEVEVQSPAFVAEINKGDIIYKMDDVVISNMTTFFNQIAKHNDKDRVVLTIQRYIGNELKSIEIPVTLGVRS